MSQYRESREDKFRRLAEARVNKILHLYRLLGNLSWTGTYAYTKDQVDHFSQNPLCRSIPVFRCSEVSLRIAK